MTTTYKRLRSAFMLLLSAFILLTAVDTEAAAKDFVVVIDAGHGGKDGGAPGRSSCEKDINLAVAKKLGKILENKYKGIKVVYTRSTDVFVTIKGRMDKAKAAKANLFISLHCNSAAKENPNRKNLSGTSVYVLGNNNANDNIDLAMRENSAILLEDDYTTSYKGFDNSPEYYIFTEISQSKMMGKSNAFANAVQTQLVKHAGLVDKHVNETSRLWLLLHSTMPAILIEMDYICNPRREEFLNSESGQKKIAEAIGKGVDNYRRSLGYGDTRKDSKETAAPAEAPATEAPEAATPEADTKTRNGELVYKIQICISPKKLSPKAPELKGLSPVDYYREGKGYKYTFGSFPTVEEANAALKEIKKKFSDAFVIKTRNGKRIR